MNYQWFDFVGNVGVFLILVSYLLLQIEKIESKSVSYSLTNAIGAVLIIISLCFDFNLSSFTIEVFWLLISLYGLVHIMRTNRAQ
jgi:multidrug transporter EmrE-like cation transporter